MTLPTGESEDGTSWPLSWTIGLALNVLIAILGALEMLTASMAMRSRNLRALSAYDNGQTLGVLATIGGIAVDVGLYGTSLCLNCMKPKAAQRLRWFIVLYFDWSIGLVILVLLSALIVFTAANGLQDAFKSGFDMSGYAGNQTTRDVIDGMQTTLKCCGNYNYSEWFGVALSSPKKGDTRNIPQSCCKRVDCVQTVKIGKEDTLTASEQGCVAAASQSYGSVLKLRALFLISIAIVGIAATSLVWLEFKKLNAEEVTENTGLVGENPEAPKLSSDKPTDTRGKSSEKLTVQRKSSQKLTVQGKSSEKLTVQRKSSEKLTAPRKSSEKLTAPRKSSEKLTALRKSRDKLVSPQQSSDKPAATRGKSSEKLTVQRKISETIHRKSSDKFDSPQQSSDKPISSWQSNENLESEQKTDQKPKSLEQINERPDSPQQNAEHKDEDGSEHGSLKNDASNGGQNPGTTDASQAERAGSATAEDDD